MNVFVPFASPLQTAKCLDRRRLNKQIIECRQILSALKGETKAWANHPATLMYAEHTDWLTYYVNTLECHARGEMQAIHTFNSLANDCTPPFLTTFFCNQHKRRLYTKDQVHYRQFASLGCSEDNWYVVDGELRIYRDGKRIN